jgi:hypothetical protein
VEGERLRQALNGFLLLLLRFLFLLILLTFEGRAIPLFVPSVSVSVVVEHM